MVPITGISNSLLNLCRSKNYTHTHTHNFLMSNSTLVLAYLSAAQPCSFKKTVVLQSLRYFCPTQPFRALVFWFLSIERLLCCTFSTVLGAQKSLWSQECTMPQDKDISSFEKPLILNLVFNRFAAAGAVTPASSICLAMLALFQHCGLTKLLWAQKLSLNYKMTSLLFPYITNVTLCMFY